MKYEKIKALENDNRLVLSGKSLRVKDYWNERENEGKRIDTLWNDLPQNTAGSDELEAIMEKSNTFDNPKPTDLIKRCPEIGNRNGCVLDFFAGFRVIIMTQANSQVDTRVLEFLSKFKIKKMNRWCAV